MTLGSWLLQWPPLAMAFFCVFNTCQAYLYCSDLAHGQREPFWDGPRNQQGGPRFGVLNVGATLCMLTSHCTGAGIGTCRIYDMYVCVYIYIYMCVYMYYTCIAFVHRYFLKSHLIMCITLVGPMHSPHTCIRGFIRDHPCLRSKRAAVEKYLSK